MNRHKQRDNSIAWRISAREANRRFSEVLQAVEAGRTVVVTSHGNWVAKIVPCGEDERAAAARAARFARLREEPFVNAGPWTRDDLYDDLG